MAIVELFKRACFAGVILLSTPVFAENVQITDEARQHFKAGVNFMQDPDGARYEEAYREFKAAYTASPSWKILGNLGIAAMKLERDGEAIDAMQKYLEEGKGELPDEERAQFERDLATLRASVVHVKLSSVPEGAVVSDVRTPVSGSPIVNQYTLGPGELDLGIRAGNHKMTARIAGYQDAVWEFEASPSSTQSHAFELQKPSAAAPLAPPPAAEAPPAAVEPGAPAEGPTPTGAYIGLAATGAFTAGAVVTGIMALGKKSDYDAANGKDHDKAANLRDSTKTLNLVTDVFIGAAVVSAAVTTYLYVSRPGVTPEESAGLSIEPLVGRDSAMLGVEGSF